MIGIPGHKTQKDNTAEAQFVLFLKKNQRAVYKIASTYALSPHDQEDLSQDIKTELWKAWPTYNKNKSNEITWLYRVSLNVAISYVRNKTVRTKHTTLSQSQTIEEAECPNTADHEKDEHLRILYDFVKNQDPLDRALLLMYLDDQPQKIIADVLGITESNVSTKIGRLKDRLKNEFN